jgi:hypothetical protein
MAGPGCTQWMRGQTVVRIINKTQYDTRTLRRIIAAVHRVLARSEGRLPAPEWKALEVEVIHRRGRGDGLRGRAYRRGAWMQLALPMPGLRSREPRLLRRYPETSAPDRFEVLAKERWPEAHDVASLVEHELFHLYGYGHRQMRGAESGPEFWARRVGTGPIPLRPARAKARGDRVSERYERAREAMKKWEARAKRAQTMLRKARRRVRYYEKQLAARSIIPVDSAAGDEASDA